MRRITKQSPPLPTNDQLEEAVMDAAVKLLRSVRNWQARPYVEHIVSKESGNDGSCGIKLPPRLFQVLVGMANGQTSTQISRRLGTSPATARTQMGVVNKRIGGRDRAHSVALALIYGIITADDITDHGNLDKTEDATVDE
jgi:DNA-binding NarL/FixJ family response regulator